MRFIKKFVFVVLLLILAFFLYRWISPNSANSLLSDLKSFSNTSLGTTFDLTGDTIAFTGVSLDVTGTVLDMTGTIVATGIVASTGDDLLLNDVELAPEFFPVVQTTGIVQESSTGLVPTVVIEDKPEAPVSSPIIQPKPTKPIAKPSTKKVIPKTTTSPQSHNDFLQFLQNFIN